MKAIEFLKSLPDRVETDTVQGLQTLFHFDLSGEGGGQCTLNLENNSVSVTDGLKGDPKCVVKSDAQSFMKLIRGELNPMVALMTGKISVSDKSEMLKYAKVLGLM